MFLMAVHYPALERGAILCWLHYFHDSNEMTMGGLKMKEYSKVRWIEPHHPVADQRGRCKP